MKRFLVLALLLISILAPISMRGSSALAQTVGGVCADSEESAFLQLINVYRAENGLGPLALSYTLSVAADTHSMDMAANENFSHTGTDGSSFVDRLSAAGYPNPGGGGEIIFAGRSSSADAMAGWQSSPAHNAAMLDPNYTAIGIARANNPDSTWQWYWTSEFGPTIDGPGC